MTGNPIKGQSIQRKDTHHSQDGKQKSACLTVFRAHNKDNPLQFGEKEKEKPRGKKQPVIHGELLRQRKVRKHLPGRLPAVG